ncbi:MAG: hypothetical protein IJ017_07460 [Oscillospiraceae bacterium]|nr:hypothetical protein [Oscillospiraceae bacterium]
MYNFPSVTDRVKVLRQRYRDSLPTIDSERTRILTDYYKESMFEVPMIRRAKALYNILSKCTVRIEPDELIVGNTGKYYKGCMIFAEYNSLDWMPREFADGTYDARTIQEGKAYMAQEDRDYFCEVAPFWHDNCVGGRTTVEMPEEFPLLCATGAIPYHPMRRNQSHGHFNANYRKVVDTGFGAIKAEALQKLEELKGNIGGNDAEKWYFYRSVVISCDAAMIFSKRLGAEARRQAEEAEGKRKEELLKMADSLEWIMENPCRSFYEAVQAVYLYHLILCYEGSYLGLTIGRFDQHVGDYLERDLKNGVITYEKAQEIIDCFCLKVADLIGSGPKAFMTVIGSYSGNMRLTLGGRKKDGTDASNTATYMTLNSMARLKLHDPNTSLCVHEDTPAELWEAGVETSKLCGGNPTFDNADLIIGILQERGLSLEDARNFCIVGCVELSGSGCEFANVSAPFSRTFLTIPQVLVHAINNGINPVSGIQGGKATGYLYEMETFEDVKKAFADQLEYIMDWQHTFDTLTEYVGNPQVPVPIASATVDGCMESGRDMLVGGAKYNSTGNACIGIGTCIDSLLAIRYAVFEKKICTARELYDAWIANWEGYEDLRQRIINDTPFFGNGDPKTDEIASWVSDMYTSRINSYRGPRGGYQAGIYSAGVHVDMGKGVFATPNGRKAGAPLSDGASPTQGADKCGPTGVAQSVLALHPKNYRNGIQFNMKFHPKAVEGEEGVMKLRSFVEAFFEQGGMQVQYNIVSSDVLKAAQKNPEEHRDLVVRVAGFSAYFIELVPELQNDLISRTDNMSV